MKSVAVLFLTICSTLSAAPRLNLSANAIQTVYLSTGSNGPVQTVQAFNTGDGTLNLTATTSASWLSAAVGAKTACSQPGGSCYPISISLNTSSVPAGTFTEYVTVSDPNAIDSPQDISVTINTNGVPGTINAYVAPFGSPNANAMFPIYTKGTGIQAAVTTQSGGNWLQFLNGGGLIVTYPTPYLVQVSARPGQAPGSYSGSIVLTGSSIASENKTINVTLNVTNSPVIDTTAIAPVRLTSYTGGATQYAFSTFNNLGQGTLTVTSATSTSNFLTATVSAPDTILIAANPAGLAAGIYNGSVTLASNASNSSQVSVPVELVVAPAGAPVSSFGGLVNIATFAQEPVSAGDIVAIFGTQLGPVGSAATNATTPLATTLAGTQVLVNGVPAPLYFVSPGQINFQVPYSLTAGQTASVQVVSNGTQGNLRPLSIVATAPRLLYFTAFLPGGYGIIVNSSDGSLTLPSGTNVPGFATHPAKPGDTLVIYGVGFGQTTPAAVEGQAASGTTLESIPNVVTSLGGGFLGNSVFTNAAFAGLTPTAVGLYQINVTLPANAPLGASIPLSVNVNGAQSNSVVVAISASGK